MKLQVKAQLKGYKTSPRKMRLIADSVKGMKAEKALDQLFFSKKNPAKPLAKLIKSAMANAKHNHNMEAGSLMIKNIFVDSGAMQYRWMPRAMGRATPIRKRSAHITVILEGDAKDKDEKQDEGNAELKKSGKKKIKAAGKVPNNKY